MKRLALLLIVLPLFCAGCFGFLFGPGIPSTAKDIFAEPPVVIKKGEQYLLRWRYGSAGFFFQPRYQVREGALWFSLQATASSGNLSGKVGEILIEGQREIAALKKGGAVWWSSDGSHVPLAIEEEPVQGRQRTTRGL